MTIEVLIDEVLPDFDVGRVDVVVVDGTPDDVYRVMVDYDLVEVDRDDRLIAELVGRFWGGPVHFEQITPGTFATFDRPGSARIAASMAVHPYSKGRVLVTYETRTAATDDDARRGIRRYWRLLSPFIGIVLRGALKGVKRRVEQAERED